MQVGMALTPNSLARRKPGVQIPSPPPPTLQVRASPASSGRRSRHVPAALRPRAQVAVQLRRLPRYQATRPGPPTMTTERSRRLRSELCARSDARHAGLEATWLRQMVEPSAATAGRPALGPFLAVWLSALRRTPRSHGMQTRRTRTRNARTPTRDTGRPHPDIGQRTRGHRMRRHRALDTGRADAWTRTGHRTLDGRTLATRMRTGRPRPRWASRHPGHHDAARTANRVAVGGTRGTRRA
jgi:hypothetical protein